MANSNTTISIGWKISDAAGDMKQIIMSADDLRKVMKMNVEEARKLEDRFFNFAAFCTSIDSLFNTLGSLKSYVDLSSAYDI